MKRRLWVAMRLQDPSRMFELRVPSGRVEIAVQRATGDPIGYLPVFETREAAETVAKGSGVFGIEVVE